MSSSTIRTIFKEISADLDTPISVYLKLRNHNPSFLLESVEGGENIARYSFIGVNPVAQYVLYADHIDIFEGSTLTVKDLNPGEDPTHFLQQELASYPVEHLPGLPRFIGGLVGYMGYEMVKFFEPSLQKGLKTTDTPLGHYLLTETIIAFDHARRSLFIITHLFHDNHQKALARLDTIIKQITSPLVLTTKQQGSNKELITNMDQNYFEQMVLASKEHIKAGDIFQVVLSQQFSKVSDADPFNVYRTSRRLNPSPYMYFFDFGRVTDKPFYLVGSSPEMFVRLENNIASLRPIAGTRHRGQTPLEDEKLMAELKADIKENAEHVMLVDLGRNDLGRVCQFGSVQVTDFAMIEKYSHVMHLVSNVEGKLQPGLNAFDLVRSAFPAGTVSGAPKIRAMELINELEQRPRGAYGGMVGYFGFDGAMDTCLTIRTLVVDGNQFTVQAGAGIVADSDPKIEYQETINKASAMLKAIDLTERSD